MDGLDTRVHGLDPRVDRLDPRVDGLDPGVNALDIRVDRLDPRVDRLPQAWQSHYIFIRHCSSTNDVDDVLDQDPRILWVVSKWTTSSESPVMAANPGGRDHVSVWKPQLPLVSSRSYSQTWPLSRSSRYGLMGLRRNRPYTCSGTFDPFSPMNERPPMGRVRALLARHCQRWRS